MRLIIRIKLLELRYLRERSLHLESFVFLFEQFLLDIYIFVILND